MMKKKRSSVMLATIGILGMILLSGCGAGDSGDKPAPTPDPGTTGVASMKLLVSNPQLNSDGATTVALTAVVLDSNNRTLPDKTVSFFADSGVLTVASGTTDASGTATATLGTGGDPTNRVIHLTASAGAVSVPNTVTVTGTTLSISGAASLSFGDSTPLTIFLKDSAGAGILGKTITVTSLKGNTLSAATYVTNASGQATVNVAATVGGADKITASAIGATKEFDLTVNTAILTFITPSSAAVTEIPIETNRSVTVEYVSGTTPQAGVTVNFLTTRGVLSSSAATTGADGRATVTVSSTNSGPGQLTAAVAAGPTSQVAVEFVATTVSSLDLKASPAAIGTNSGGSETEKSLITATVRDANNNLVKNKTVSFTIVSDVSGGRLSPASAITDSSGSASTYFIAGASTGGLGGVTIRATVLGTSPSVTTTTALTVAKKALFISLATGPTIIKVDPNKYQQDYVALVTDSAGNPVVGATVVATITPVYYAKGYFIWPKGATSWQQVGTLEAPSSTRPDIPACANEDGITGNPIYDFNGRLDPGEDQNGNGVLDPGNVASVTAATTDSTGHATVSVVYARDYAYWVYAKLETFANDLKGSTASASVSFALPGYATDYTNQNASPPGNPSPFGMSTSCYVDLTVVTVSSSQMAITWQKSPTANHYHVYRNGINVANAAQNKYDDTGLASGTLFCYQIRTVDAAGTEALFTGTVCNSTATLPPSGLTATAISPSQIRLSWTALAGATGYRIYQDAGLGLVPLTSVVSTSAVVSGLMANTLYCYAVSANNAAGVESPLSAQVCATTQLSAPSTPTGLAAVGSASPSPRVTLTWNASAGASTYRIYRDGTLALWVSSPAVSVVDTGLDIISLKPLTGYCYAISAVGVSGNESAQSTQVCTSTGPPPPPKPTGLTATLLAGPQVRLNWSASSGAVVYRIYRNAASVPVLSAAGTTATDTSVVTGSVYCYTVAAEDSSGNASAQSTAVCVATGAVAPPPTPTNLLATPNVSPLRMTLTWTTSVGAVSYRIYRNGGTIPYLSATGAQVTDTSVAAQTQYCYTISAVDGSGNESAQSTPPSCAITGLVGPPTPTGLSATPNVNPPRVTLTWSASTGAVSYRIYRNGGYLMSSTAAPATDAAVVVGTTYCYTISAVDGSGNESAQSATPACVIPGAPPTPTGLAATPLPAPPAAPTRVNLTWSASTGAVNYRIYRNGVRLFPLDTITAAPAVDFGPFAAATMYCYTISAVDGSDTESARSTTPVCVTTP